MKDLTEKQKQDLIEINAKLAEVKTKIKEFYQGSDTDRPQSELVLYIRDKHSSPWRKQTEDIEGDVDEMRVIST